MFLKLVFFDLVISQIGLNKVLLSFNLLSCEYEFITVLNCIQNAHLQNSISENKLGII